MAELTWNRNPVLESRHSRYRPMAPSSHTPDRLDPCASTASLFLYAQGSAITCLHHDTLALERRFDGHEADISFISVDNVSERGAGRLVVSYDAAQMAIVWDLFTGATIARFSSFEDLRVASWMRNGNIAFGISRSNAFNSLHANPRRKHKGRSDSLRAVVVGTHIRSNHLRPNHVFSTGVGLSNIRHWVRSREIRWHLANKRRYQNGSILIATLLPIFTILHTLTSSRGPSSITSLAWHASSTKQKSDMLATQTANGDLRVWSISKPPGKVTPRAIRVLRRSDPESSTPKWMAWSKNGKIVQFLNG